ncbi:GNAT family N-acetyltransferase [Lacticaseibacillus daqingensis]|uniref:GNAT family N-acetyltransferase n=1 Tax=Lacticaseibacillus daqingensis TaxID=2486014 RepID=UPI000F789128|nr:GNAT family protein [Lacticaseibacillus daqingensis]
MTITLRPLTPADADTLYTLAYGANRDWMTWDAPYFAHPVPDRETFARSGLFQLPFVAGILVDQTLVGTVTAYYEDDELKRWLECGIVIYQPTGWNHGVGSQALRLWAHQLFAHTDLPHLSLTTWSGNVRMMHAATRAGFREEGRLRQVRFWQGRYWDSMKYGMLREELPELR